MTCFNDDVTIIPGNGAAQPVVLNHKDPDGTEWILTDLDGWWGLPTPNLLDIPRTQKADGSYDVEGAYNARTVTIRGTIRPSGPILLQFKRQQLMRAVDTVRGNPATLVVGELPPKQAYGRLADQPQFAVSKVNNQADFEIVMKFPDPAKYTTTLNNVSCDPYIPTTLGRTFDETFDMSYPPAPPATSLQAECPNIGSIPTPPRYVLRGPLLSPQIFCVNTGEKLSFPGLSIPSGVTLVVDTQEHTAILDGTSFRSSYLTAESRWFFLPPGDNFIRLIAEGGTGDMTVSWRSAWMD